MGNDRHAAPTTNLRALKVSAFLILIYFVLEAAVAVWTGSLSLLADAGHELSTFVAILISLSAIRVAGKAATPTRTFGYLRIETLAALSNGILLLFMAGFIVVRGVDRIANPMEVASLPMFVMAIGGIGLGIASMIIMYRGQKESLNMRGSYWHVINAFLGSLAVIIAALFIAVAKVYVADAWAGIVFAFVLSYAAFGIIRDAALVLIDATPKNIDLEEIEEKLLKIDGVTSIHHVHARTLSGNVTAFSCHLVVGDLDLAGRVLRQAKELVDSGYGFSLSTIQVEEDGLVEADKKEIDH